MKPVITNLTFNKEAFDHFLEGDGEVWYDDENRCLVDKEDVEKIVEDCCCETEDDRDSLLRELHLYESYSDFEEWLDYFEDGRYDLMHETYGDKEIMIIATICA